MQDIKTPEDFQEKVLSADMALLDLWAPWCQPCRILTPRLEHLQARNPDIAVVKANVDENQELAKALSIRSIPTVILFKKGVAIQTLVGVQTPERLQQVVDQAKD